MKKMQQNFNSVRTFLEQKRRDIEKRLATLKQDDPFEDAERLNDNAASDTEAREEEGHERVEAISNELEVNLSKVKQALSKIGIGKYGICERCKKSIDKARLNIFPMAQYCLSCEKDIEAGKK